MWSGFGPAGTTRREPLLTTGSTSSLLDRSGACGEKCCDWEVDSVFSVCFSPSLIFMWSWREYDCWLIIMSMIMKITNGSLRFWNPIRFLRWWNSETEKQGSRLKLSLFSILKRKQVWSLFNTGGIRKTVVKIEPKLTINSTEMTWIPNLRHKIYESLNSHLVTTQIAQTKENHLALAIQVSIMQLCAYCWCFRLQLRTKTIHDAGHYAETCSLDSSESFESLNMWSSWSIVLVL